MRRRLCALSLGVLLTATLLAQSQPKKVTVVTAKGDVIEGVLRGATDTELSIEVAGQLVKIPLDTLNYVSFVGRIDGSTAAAASVPAASPLDAAFAGFQDLQMATEIGVLRPQYSEKLGTALRPVQTFLSQPDDSWADVKTAMKKAIELYQWPLSDLDSWKDASSLFNGARRWVDYAKTLAALPGDATHKENPAERKIEPHGSFSGRLGSGDRPLPAGYLGSKLLSIHYDGGPSDVLSFDLSTAVDFDVEMSCTPCGGGLVLLDGSNKKIDSDMGLPARIKKHLEPGHYVLLATTPIDQAGTYRLLFK